MVLKEFAQMLDGREYNYPQFTKEELQIAKDNGFVIVFGASDDLMEFEGSLSEEAGCFNGGKVYFDKSGNLLEEQTENSRCIEAVWCDKEAVDEIGRVIPWTYKMNVPHETFMVLEDGEPYCKGMVFRLEDV